MNNVIKVLFCASFTVGLFLSGCQTDDSEILSQNSKKAEEVKQNVSNKTSPVITKQHLEEICVNLNKSFPRNIDANTIAFKAECGDGKTLIYHLQIIDVDEKNFDVEFFKTEMKKRLNYNYKNATAIKPFRDNQIAIIYKYYSPSKKLFAEFTIK
ncbi:hypothetical protein AAEX28_00975 [Lentisphaerota bacterium WC36G]|nr:hypothetical protein LJT99_03855 [Lentisphaerae bacterium WC36]